MVAEESDAAMPQVELPPSIFEVVHVKMQGDRYHYCARQPVVVDSSLNVPKKKRAKLDAAEKLAASEKENAALKSELAKLRRGAGLQHVEIQRRDAANADHNRIQRKQAASKLKCQARDHEKERAVWQVEREALIAEQRVARDARLRELNGQVHELRTQVASTLVKLEFTRSQLAKQTTLTYRNHDRISELEGEHARALEAEKASNKRDAEEMLAAVADKENEISELEAAKDELEEKLALATAGPGPGAFAARLPPPTRIVISNAASRRLA